MNPIDINKELATKVLQTVDFGLSCGLGTPEPGQMCIEAAVNFAMGLPHGDNPSCVGGAVRSFKIALNDAPWSSKEARAKGLRKIAIAQLGSNTIDQIEFARRMAIKNAQVVLPVLFRKLEMEEVAKKLEAADDLDKVIDAAKYAAKSAKSAAESAESAAESAKYAAKYAAESAKYDPDFFFKLSAGVCLQVLVEMKSPGCEFLYLTEN